MKNNNHLSMATALSRNLRSRIITRHLCSQTFNQWKRSTIDASAPSFNTAPGGVHIFRHRFLPSALSIIPLGHGVHSLEIHHRYLSTTPAAVPPEDSSSKSSEQSGQSGESPPGGNEGKSVRGGPVSWFSFFLLIATGACLVFYYDREKKRHIEGINTSSNAVKPGPSVGKAAIGGPFNLVNHEGKNVTEKDFLKKWTIIYFGFTHCPEICPDELQKLAAAIDKIKENAGIDVVPVFISVDPERDTVEQVREYVAEFHPKLIGLTGSPDEIRKVARAYRVYYMKTLEEDSDYLVDHSIIMYLMSPRMDFVKYFGKNYNVDELVDGVIKEIKQYK